MMSTIEFKVQIKLCHLNAHNAFVIYYDNSVRSVEFIIR